MNAAKRCRKPRLDDAREEEMTSNQTAATVTCIECGFENPAGIRFCGQCGAALPLLCPACGAENPPELKFCGQCGGPLGETGQPAASPETVREAMAEKELADLIEITEEKEPRSFTEERLNDLIEFIEGKGQDVVEELRDEAAERAEEVLRERVEELTGLELPKFLTCKVCEMVNPATQVYCLVCGAVVAPMGALCPACGVLNSSGTLFCDHCGHRLGIEKI
jgi:hypothetical protein